MVLGPGPDATVQLSRASWPVVTQTSSDVLTPPGLSFAAHSQVPGMGCGSCVTTGTLKNGWTSAFVSSAHGSSGPDEAPAAVTVAPGDAVSTTPGPWLRSGTLLEPVPTADVEQAAARRGTAMRAPIRAHPDVWVRILNIRFLAFGRRPARRAQRRDRLLAVDHTPIAGRSQNPRTGTDRHQRLPRQVPTAPSTGRRRDYRP